MAEMSEPDRRALEEKLKSMSPEELKEYQKKQCIFCRMASGEIPCKKVFEDDKVFAIMDINPAAAGHVLLLPKEHHMLLQQMPEELVAHIGLIAKAFSQVFLQSLKTEGVTQFGACGGVAGQRAQHFILHLIPRKEGDKVGIAIKGKPLSPQESSMVKSVLQPYVNSVMGVKREQPKTPAPSVLSSTNQSLQIPTSKPAEKSETPTITITSTKSSIPQSVLESVAKPAPNIEEPSVQQSGKPWAKKKTRKTIRTTTGVTKRKSAETDKSSTTDEQSNKSGSTEPGDRKPIKTAKTEEKVSIDDIATFLSGR